MSEKLGKASPFEDEDIQQQESLVIDVVEEFLGNSSVHGFPYIVARGHYKPWKQLLWGTFVALCLGLLLMQVVATVRQFLGYKVLTTTETIVPATLPFPDVTICDPNEVQDFPYGWFNDDELFGPFDEGNFPRNATELENLFTLLPSSLTFNNRQIKETDFVPVVTENGLCLRFSTNETVKEGGRKGGLRFWGFLDQSRYLDTTLEAGVLVYIHEKGTQVSSQSKALFVRPGTVTSLLIERERFEREREAPWSRCYSAAPAYTQSQCRAECIFNRTRDSCGCRMMGDWIESDLDFCPFDVPVELDDDLWFTKEETRNGPFVNCRADRPKLEDTLNTCPCDLPPCIEEKYPTTVSSMALSEPFFDQLADLGTKELIESGMVFVLINYGNIEYKRQGETKEMTRTDLLASLGGSMGLFLGISVVSIVEIIGELGCMRLLPRLWGDRRLFGLGGIPQGGSNTGRDSSSGLGVECFL